MAFSNLALFGGAFFTPILVGKITHTIGWPWSFYFVAIFCGAMLPLVFFFVPETAFRRDDSLNTDIKGEESIQRTPCSNTTQSPNSSIPTSLEKDHYSNPEHRSTSQKPQKLCFARSLLPFNGRKTDESFLKLVLRPLPLFLHPAILWACLIQGALIGWTVMIGVVLAAIFLGPPLWYDEVQTGYMYTGPFIGAILGFLLAGLLADWSAKIMIRSNKGIYEPEFRILLVVAQLVFGCAGLYGFGITANNVAKYGWFWPDFFYALEVMGMVLGAVASALYIADAHRKLALILQENHGSVNVLKATRRGYRRRSLHVPLDLQKHLQLRLDVGSIPLARARRRVEGLSCHRKHSGRHLPAEYSNV